MSSTIQNTNKSILQQAKPRFLELVDEKTFKRELSFALQILAANRYLDRSTAESKLQSILNVAQTGLTLNPVIKHAYLVPRYQNSNVECTLMPSYQGLIHLMMTAGGVKKIGAHVVREGDEFEYSLGLSPDVIHKPKCNEGCAIISAYAYAQMNNGSVFVEVMDREALNSVRDMSESYKKYKKDSSKQSPWVTWESEMCRKAVVKRLSKYLPKTDSWENVQVAIEVDNEDYRINMKTVSFIESLLQTATIDHDEKFMIEESLNDMTPDESQEVIKYLKRNQLNGVHEGKASQKEITSHIAEISGINKQS